MEMTVLVPSSKIHRNYMIVYKGTQEMIMLAIVLAKDNPMPQPKAANPDVSQLAAA